jgi:hypothetical protein
MNGDDDLREAFARLRDADAQDTPRFAMPCVQPRKRMRMLPAIATVLLLVAIVVVYVARPTSDRRAEVRIETWRAPTDFLLKTPGSDLTSSVPQLQPHVPIIKGDRS